jgi:hypothetical protein
LVPDLGRTRVLRELFNTLVHSPKFAPDECPRGIMDRRDRGRPPPRKEVAHERPEEPARRERRRRLIERLNDKEKLIGPHSPARRGQMSEEDLAAEIEKQRTLPGGVGSRSSVYLLYSP